MSLEEKIDQLQSGRKVSVERILKHNVQESVLLDHNRAARENFDSIYWIKQFTESEDYHAVAEYWLEISQEDQHSLWVAPSKGGIFTTHERKVIKENASRYG